MAFSLKNSIVGEHELAYIANGSYHNVTADLGDDEEYSVSYFLLVSLAPCPGGAFAELELAFSVGQYEPEFDSEYLYWDGQDTKHHISDPEHRKFILALICASVQHLIEQAAPTSVFLQTCSANLPEKAKAKYKHILNIFRKNNYSIRTLEEYHGYEAWTMQLIAQP